MQYFESIQQQIVTTGKGNPLLFITQLMYDDEEKKWKLFSETVDPIDGESIEASVSTLTSLFLPDWNGSSRARMEDHFKWERTWKPRPRLWPKKKPRTKKAKK